MARNGSGTYSLPAGNPVVTGTTISSTWANNTLTDIATALTGSLAADGQTPVTGNIPMGGFKLTGLAAGAVAGDSVRYEQFASPPAIGGTAAAPITGTTITATTQFSGPGTGLTGTAASLSIGGNAATATTATTATTANALATTAGEKLPTIGCTQSGGALTFTASSQYLDFRSTTLTSGTISTVLCAPSNLVLPSGGTLGAVTTVSARIVVVEINNAGTAELAIVNIAGGNSLDETGVINTTAISASSTSNNVFYSTTARTGVAYRVVGAVDAVNTAGAWGNPTLVQPAGGNALTAMNSLGYGQTWQDLTGSRALSTTYYNTTGKPREIKIRATVSNSQAVTLTVGGVEADAMQGESGTAILQTLKTIVPPGAAYTTSVSGTPVLQSWTELL